MRPILEVHELSKKFRIQHEDQGYLNIRDRITTFFKSRSHAEEFWALKDLNFSMMPGDSLGIIGRNGAGKSTLLKILSKITPPTSGKIITRGKVASLLEVGTGFHPELTGRENIFLNGSILGMKRHEVALRFDEIVDFAGTEKFLDTQLKHYSSGMQLRLAFAVAAFLEPQILVIDEVLAVGDAEFQKKCIGKMEDISRGGRTIIFVSHNLAAIKVLCNNGLVLNKGEQKFLGDINSSVEYYANQISAHAWHEDGITYLTDHPSKKNRERGLYMAQLYSNGKKTSRFKSGDNFRLELFFKDTATIREIVIGIVIKDINNQNLLGVNNWDTKERLNDRPVEKGKVVFEMEKLPLYGNSTYSIDIYFGDGGDNYDTLDNAVSFHIEPSDIFGKGKFLDPKLNLVNPGSVQYSFHKD